MAKMTVNVIGNPIFSCGENLNIGGNIGIYEIELSIGSSLGYTGIKYDAAGIPDRFELYYNDIKVGDSKFVGDGIFNPSSPYGGIILGPYTLDNYIYDGTDFVPTGTSTDIVIASTDISDNITEPTNGNGVLLFNKTTSSPTTIKLKITGSPNGGTTAWQAIGVCPIDEDDLIEGEEKLMYGFFTEPNKALQSRSGKFILGTSPVKFYTNILGDTNFNNFGYTGSLQYINDGITWYQIDATGNILSTGTI